MRSSRLPLSCALALGGALLFAPSSAWAEEEEEAPRKKRRMVVTVEDDEDVEEEDEAPRKGRKKREAPEIGAPAAEVEAYLGELKAENAILKDRLKQAKRSGDDEAVAELLRESAEANALYKAERDRLTTQNPGMIAGGATLIGLGGVSFVASIVLVAGWGLSGIDGNTDDEWGWGALGCLAGGVVGIGAGTPLLVIGLIREPKSPTDAKATPPTPIGVGSGLTLTVPF